MVSFHPGRIPGCPSKWFAPLPDQPAKPYGSSTQESLLRNFAGYRFAPDDFAAETFIEKYRPLIGSYLQKITFYQNDIDDLIQDVLLKILKGISSFERRGAGSFRAWLKSIVQSVHTDWLRQLMKDKKIKNLDPETIQNLGASIEKEFVDQHEKELMSLAIARAKLEFPIRIWDMFEGAKVKGLPAAEIARKHSTSVVAVYAASRRVMHRLKEIVQTLDTQESTQG